MPKLTMLIIRLEIEDFFGDPWPLIRSYSGSGKARYHACKQSREVIIHDLVKDDKEQFMQGI